MSTETKEKIEQITFDITHAGVTKQVTFDHKFTYVCPVCPEIPPAVTKDKWGIQMLNASNQDPARAREWYLNETNPDDGQFYRKGGTITKEADGSYSCDGAVRLYVKSPQPFKLWKNIEITGYFKVLAGAVGRNAIQEYGRGGIHTDSNYTLANGQSKSGNPMGSKYSCRIYTNGDVLSAKEIGHSVYAGYRSAKSNAVADLAAPSRWIGWKTVINQYTKNGRECASMKGYIDDNAQDASGNLTPKNNWVLMTSAVDEGDWNNFDAAEFTALVNKGAVPAGMTADQYKSMIITWSGHPVFVNDTNQRAIACTASYRWDDIKVAFKHLSVREIVPG